MKKNTKIILGAAVVVALIALASLRSCQPGKPVAKIPATEPEKKTEIPFINPVSAKLDVPFTEYTVIAGRDTQIVHPSGSKITIPACAFSKNGTALANEQVKLKYREFHSKEELVGAGIPMTVSGNTNELLETTGMMELRAYQGEEPLEVSNGCALTIELANNEAGENVNIYQLDEKKKSWIEKVKALPAKVYTSSKKITVKKKVDESKYKTEALKAGYFKPVKPRVANPKKYSFHFKINLQQYPELNVYDGILWEYAGKGGADDPGSAANKWVQSATWREMRIKGTDREEIYQLTLSTRDQSFTTIVRPVFEKEDMEYANDVFKDRYSKYRAYMDKKNANEARMERVEKQTDLITRSFQINQFGVWNCDRYFNIEDPMVVTFNFVTPDTSLSVKNVYIMEKNVNGVVQLSPQNNSLIAIKLKKSGDYGLLLFDSEGRFHKIANQEVAALFKQGSTISVPVKPDGVEMASLDDLKKWM